MSQKKYVSLSRLSDFLTKLKDLFATKTELATKATTNHGIYYGTCDSAASSTVKTVTLTDDTGFSLTEGTVVIVKFNYSNNASNPMMNVNLTGAKYMKRQGTVAIPASSASYGWQLGAVQIFVYDGENWVRDYWYNSTYSNFSLGHGYGTCDTEEATLEKVVSTTGLVAVTGGFLAIKFANAVPANSTLKINSNDSSAIYYNGAAIPDGIIKAGDTATFVYDDVFHLIAVNRDTYSKTEIDSLMEQKSQVQIITWEDDD